MDRLEKLFINKDILVNFCNDNRHNCAKVISDPFRFYYRLAIFRTFMNKNRVIKHL